VFERETLSHVCRCQSLEAAACHGFEVKRLNVDLKYDCPKMPDGHPSRIFRCDADGCDLRLRHSIPTALGNNQRLSRFVAVPTALDERDNLNPPPLSILIAGVCKQWMTVMSTVHEFWTRAVIYTECPDFCLLP
jgi:hypothetical protein